MKGRDNGKPNRRWESNIKIGFNKMVFGDVECIEDNDQLRPFVSR